ncbi:MAG TPA: membrane dipeptidase [Phycisphaerae bacterium]|nr:membrane dipeptidase [Phycisphaerae bacterium]
MHTLSKLYWFDAHLDLAYLAVQGRNMLADETALAKLDEPGAISLHSLANGQVRRAAATIFVQPRGIDDVGRMVDGPWCYGNADEAYDASIVQLDWYRQAHEKGLLEIIDRSGLQMTQQSPMQIMLLLEGAAGVRRSDDLDEFYRRGVRILAATWATGTQWAGGDKSGGDITPQGRELLQHADRLKMVHDVSHLSEKAFWTLLECTNGPKISSHSNCRSLLPGKYRPERHLSDDQIKALAGVDAVMGINLYAHFLVSSGPAKVDDVVRHIEHILNLTGRSDLIALGSDMDGGFSSEFLPEGIHFPKDLWKLSEALSQKGFTNEQIEQFAWRNWNRFFEQAGLI